jgi:gluconokinase
MAKTERTLDATDDGGAEIEAEKAFKQVVATIDDVLESVSDIRGEITHVATASFWHSLLGIDTEGKPTTKVLGWADTRSRGQVTKLRKRLDEAETHNRTGGRFHPSFWPAKLLWLREERPDEFARTARWLSFSDFVSLRLFESDATSVSMASATGIFDIRRFAWDRKLTRYLRLKPAHLPEITTPAMAFALVPKFRKRWPRLKEARWFPAVGDGAANNIGAGCVTKKRAGLMVGTSGAVRVAYRGSPPAGIPAGLWCYRVDRERVIIGGALSDGGGLYQWLKGILRLPDSDVRLEKRIAKRSPAAHGLTFLPFLAGERSTGYHESATGAIIGLRSANDAVDIVQAAMESVAYRFNEIFDQLETVCDVAEIVASGGALRGSSAWTQIIADVLGRELTVPDVHEASMRGAVLLALESIGNIDAIEFTRTPEGTKFRPDLKRHEAHRKALSRHRSVYRSIIENEAK